MGTERVGKEDEGWEDALIAELKERDAGPSGAGGAGAPADALARGYAQCAESFDASVRRVAEAIGATVLCRGSAAEGRVRWTYGSRTLHARLDDSAGKFFVSVDLGADVALEELTAGAAGLVDARQHPVCLAELTRRFVGLLFRGA